MERNHPTEAELEILQVLWESQPCTIALIHEKINSNRSKSVGYTTISKQIDRMAERKILGREKEGKTYLYTSKLSEEAVQQQMSERLLKTAYKGSAAKLAMHALGQSKASLEEIEALQAWLEQQKNKK